MTLIPIMWALKFINNNVLLCALDSYTFEIVKVVIELNDPHKGKLNMHKTNRSLDKNPQVASFCQKPRNNSIDHKQKHQILKVAIELRVEIDQ